MKNINLNDDIFHPKMQIFIDKTSEKVVVAHQKVRIEKLFTRSWLVLAWSHTYLLYFSPAGALTWRAKHFDLQK